MNSHFYRETYLNNSYYLIHSIDVLVINLPNISNVLVCFKYTFGAIIHKLKTTELGCLENENLEKKLQILKIGKMQTLQI